MVGAGYIGVEMAEALIAARLPGDRPGPGRAAHVDARPGHGRPGARRDGGLGIELVTGAEVTELLDRRTTAGCAAVVTEDGEYPADLVVLGLGVAPETSLARAAGLPLGGPAGC